MLSFPIKRKMPTHSTEKLTFIEQKQPDNLNMDNNVFKLKVNV